MKIKEYERGHNDATNDIIAWLHSEALTMTDPHARRILNSAAYALGVQCNTAEAKARVAARAMHNDGKS